MSSVFVLIFLDSLAKLHATLWNDPRLFDARLGLCDLIAVLNIMQSLHENPKPLVEALKRCPYTLTHDDYAARNLAHLDLPGDFDWQIAGPRLRPFPGIQQLNWLLGGGR